MSLIVSSHQVRFLQEIQAGNRVIWHGGLDWLFCFSARFYEELKGEYLELVWQENHPGFSLAYPLRLPHKERNVPFGFTMSGLQYVVQKTAWLHHKDAAGNIPAATLIDEIEIWLKAEGSPEMEQHLANPPLTLARDFLAEEVVLIPQSVWRQALPAVLH